MHFERGRDAQRAVQYLRQAGQRSMERSAYVEADAHLTKGLEVLQTLPATPSAPSKNSQLYILGQVRHSLPPRAMRRLRWADLRPRPAALSPRGTTPSSVVPVLCGLW